MTTMTFFDDQRTPAPIPKTMSRLRLDLLIILIFCVRVSLAECPRLCECKWKSGKESVICLNANLSLVPLHLDAGTQVLDLTGNDLVAIRHEEFSRAGLVNLQKVYLAKCRLKTLERYAFKSLINLVELDLSYNALNNVPSHTFDSISELRELKLNGNPVQKIFNDAFMNLPRLIRLEIMDCKISSIEPRAFAGLEKSLEWLKLDKNKLSEVSSSAFVMFDNLNGLELAGNPWNCSCFLRPLREWMLRRNVPYDIPPVCHHPKRLSMKSWEKLELDEYACAPEIFAYNDKAHGIEGKNITMTCKIAGIPEPSVRWLLRNKVIANLSGSSYSSGKKLFVVHLTNSTSDLTIFSADLQDAGTYVCSAENKAGKAEASIILAVSKKPSENGFTNKILIASVITGAVFVLISCLISICLCSVRKKQVLQWRIRECRREDNYEKIEMNHKIVNANGGVSVNQVEDAIEANKKNGEYIVVPGGDTDQEVEDEEEGASSKGKKWSQNIDKPTDRNWNSPEHLLDPEDLHIPRRTLQETRDNIKKTTSSTSGTYKQHPLQSASSSTTIQFTPSMRRYAHPLSAPVYATTGNKELSKVSEEVEKHFPDLIENSPSNKLFEISGSNKFSDHFLTGKFYRSASRGTSESGSVSDINEIFCTLPRKSDLAHSSRYRSSDSQSPLLSESRYGSSGGESSLGSQDNGFRRMSDSQKYPYLTNLNRNRVNKTTNSYLNLTRVEGTHPKEVPIELNATPLLDVSNLESRLMFNKRTEVISPSVTAATVTTTTASSASYDYHAAQLEKFLEEYRSLQKQLTKMKKTCDNLCQEKEHYQTNSPITPSSSDSARNIANPLKLKVSPNSNKSLGESVEFKNFENELTKYLLSKSLSPGTFNSGVFN